LSQFNSDSKKNALGFNNGPVKPVSMSAQKGSLFSGSKEKNVKELSLFHNNKTPVKALRGISNEDGDAKVKSFYP
jgi:hypothetical protein